GSARLSPADGAVAPAKRTATGIRDGRGRRSVLSAGVVAPAECAVRRPRVRLLPPMARLLPPTQLIGSEAEGSDAARAARASVAPASAASAPAAVRGGRAAGAAKVASTMSTNTMM